VGGDTSGDFAGLLAAIERAPTLELRLAALAMVRDGVITGEGPTATGRIHFSRCIDATDTALIHRILTAAAGSISREEADAVLDIHDAAIERLDNGAFDDLLTRAIVHHVLAAAGEVVAPRAVALAAAVEWSRLQWAALDGETSAWLKARLNRRRRQDGPVARLAQMSGATPALSGALAATDLAA